MSRTPTGAAPLLQSTATQVNVMGNGLIDQGLLIGAANNAYVIVSGTHTDAITFASPSAMLLVNTDVEMTAGSLESVQLGSGSSFSWRGGSLLGTEGGAELFSFAGGVINVFGSAFAINGMAIAPAALYSLTNAAGLLSGVLSDGSAFSVNYNSTGTLNLISSVPEPETCALMLGGLGVVAWVARRRRPDSR